MNKTVFLLSSLVITSCCRVLKSTVATSFDSQGNPTERWEYEYDKNGNISSRTDLILKDNAFVEDTKMVLSYASDDGYSDTVKTFYKMIDGTWKPVSKVVDSYNELMLKVRTASLSYDNDNWNQDFMVSWTYDSLSRISSIRGTEWQNIYYYDSNGNITRSMSNLEDGIFIVNCVVLDSVDSNGNVIKSMTKERIPNGWREKAMIEMVYDDYNRIVKKTDVVFDGYGNADSTRIEYAYNQAGKIASESIMLIYNNQWEGSHQTVWEYNRFGRIFRKQTKRFYNEQLLDKVINEYEYDKMDNMVRETIKRMRGDTGIEYVDHSIVIDNHY